jgi:hypothetical protein
MNEKKIYEKILKENEKYYYTDIKEIISNITEYKETTNTENLSYMKESVKKQNFILKKEQIQGGSKEILIEKLIEYDYNYLIDLNYIETYLLTYKTFQKPEELMERLVKKFDMVPNNIEEIQDEKELWEYNKKLNTKRTQILIIFKRWMEDHFYDFSVSGELYERLKKFVLKISEKVKLSKTSLKVVHDLTELFNQVILI